jgi:uncharacterized membrane protein YbhN (UPF0104 family)
VALALVLLFNQYVLSAMKWRAILRSHAIDLPLGLLARSYLIGNFFSTFLPSSYGGDVVRVLDVARRTGRGFESASAVVFERLSGLAALAAAGGGASLWLSDGGAEPLFLSLGVMFLGMAAALVFSFTRPVLGAFRRLAGMAPPGAPRRLAMRILDAIEHYRSRPRLLVVVVLYSFAFQLMAYTIIFIYARALHLPLPYTYCLAFVPVIYLLEALPISVGGIGLREGGLVFFLERLQFSSSEAISLSILIVSCRYVMNLAGGALYAFGGAARTAQQASIAEEGR